MIGTDTKQLQLNINISTEWYNILKLDDKLEYVVSSFFDNYIEDLQDKQTKEILENDKDAINLTNRLKKITGKL